MKYIGWILFFLSIAVGGLFYFLGYEPLQRAYQKQKEEIKLWIKKVEEMKGKETPQDTFSLKSKDSLIYVIGTDSLFLSLKSDEIREKGKKLLEKIAEELKSSNGEILILGHTDNVPVGPSLKKLYPSNWELSTRRACVVARFLIKKGIESKRVVAAGAGPSRPLVENTTEENKRKNRRIEIYLR